MLVFSAIPIVNHVCWPADGNKDYDLWYRTGRIIIEGRELYTSSERVGGENFKFMYPPAAAIFLAPLTIFGQLPFLVILDVLNSASWILSLYLGVRMVEKLGPRPSAVLYIFPALSTIAYVYDMYLLGQPNLLLLACLLAAFFLAQRGKGWTAGALLAFTAAAKAFPFLALGYFVYRRYWKATVSTVLFLFLFVFVMPVAVRGVGRTLDELRVWSGGMLFRYDADAIAQRPEISYEWKNESLVAAAHRLLRAVPAERPDNGPSIYVNVANLDFHWISAVIVLSAALLGLGCVFASPSYRKRTENTDAVEFAMLLVLITVLSPISWFYYGVWLIYPMTVVAQFIRSRAKSVREQRIAIGLTAASILLLSAIFPFLGVVRSAGLPFFGYIVLMIELGWMLWLTRQAETVPATLGHLIAVPAEAGATIAAPLKRRFRLAYLFSRTDEESTEADVGGCTV